MPLMKTGRPVRMRGTRARTGSPVASSTSSSFSIFRWSHSTPVGTAGAEAQRGSEGHGEGQHALLVAGRNGGTGRVDDLDHLHLALLADARRRQLVGEHGVQAALAVDLAGQARVLGLAAGQPPQALPEDLGLPAERLLARHHRVIRRLEAR